MSVARKGWKVGPHARVRLVVLAKEDGALVGEASSFLGQLAMADAHAEPLLMRKQAWRLRWSSTMSRAATRAFTSLSDKGFAAGCHGLTPAVLDVVGDLTYAGLGGPEP